MDPESSWPVGDGRKRNWQNRADGKVEEAEGRWNEVEDGIRNIGRRRGIWVTESGNVEADGESLRPVDVAQNIG
jgi:hypothetical protein